MIPPDSGLGIDHCLFWVSQNGAREGAITGMGYLLEYKKFEPLFHMEGAETVCE
jgi:hypothetical protein